MPSRTNWDDDFDVVIVGYGFAGAAAAIEAHDLGARVLVLEKNTHPGGISICSAGGVRIARDQADALAYLKQTNAGTTPDGPLAALATGMTEIATFIEELALAASAKAETVWVPGTYPFDGYKTFGFISISDVPGLDLAATYPHIKGLRGGTRLFHVVERAVTSRTIDVRFSSPAKRLIQDADGRVTGLIVDGPYGEMSVAARRGVILATGGFEGDDAMKMQYWQGKPVASQAYQGNTGDGIRMAQAVGADLWHMWHYHGTYGMRHTDPAYPYGIRLAKYLDWIPGHDDEGETPDFRKHARGTRMPWIVVDAGGHRYMNEYPPYVQDTGHRPMEVIDPVSQRHLRIPSWLVMDAAGLAEGPLGLPTYNDAAQSFKWSTDNKAELELGIIKQAETLDALADIIGAPRDQLVQTVSEWNASCKSGADRAFGRMPGSIVPIDAPTFYTTPIYPMVANTQGGPAHDDRQRVLNPFGEVIGNLYVAGELGSVFGHLYISGGNLAECFIGGRQAARVAVAEPT